jgi:hypothetical protein
MGMDMFSLRGWFGFCGMVLLAGCVSSGPESAMSSEGEVREVLVDYVVGRQARDVEAALRW